MPEDTFYVALELLLFPPPVPAGMDLAVIGLHAAPMRKTNEDSMPIKVRPENGYWRIVDGRHRAVGAMVAGRKVILAENAKSPHSGGL